MKVIKQISFAAALMGGAALIALPASAQEEDSKFLDRELLVDTVMAEEEAAAEIEKAELQEQLEIAEDELEEREQLLLEAEEALDADPDNTDLQDDFDDALASVEEQEGVVESLGDQITAVDEELEQERLEVEEVADNLSDDQVTAYNQKLNNVVVQGVVVDLDADDLQAAIDDGYDIRAISAQTKAVEEYAKFEGLADRFLSKAEDTGMDHFEDKADMMLERGERQRDKFNAKIDRFLDDEAAELASESANDAAKDAAKEAAKDAAKGFAKNEAKIAAKQAAKDSAKESAKDAAKKAAKDFAKEQGRAAAKANGKPFQDL